MSRIPSTIPKPLCLYEAEIMRDQGRITDWKDNQGFGFIRPDSGGSDIFVHISAFTDRERRPMTGDGVTYAVEFDTKGRTRGRDVAFVGGSTSMPSLAEPKFKAFALAALFLALMVVAFLTGLVQAAILGLYSAAGIVTFLAYAMDKRAAKIGRRRIPEKTLHLLSLVGGWPGALVAQKLFHHKSRKFSFQLAFWGTVILNCVAFGCLLTDSGTQWLKSILKTL